MSEPLGASSVAARSCLAMDKSIAKSGMSIASKECLRSRKTRYDAAAQRIGNEGRDDERHHGAPVDRGASHAVRTARQGGDREPAAGQSPQRHSAFERTMWAARTESAGRS